MQRSQAENATEAAVAALKLPEAPATESGEVKAWEEPVEMRTYRPEPPDRNPMFLENRVYQGSSGRVYPLPFIDRVATEAVSQSWKAIHLENEFVRVMILPEIGGRIQLGFDKTTGYDFFYRQNVIKPALVGLAGPWISGGVEFNWPQHHRPATFMPVETAIERDADGAVTVWCSDHDPMLRMKGMHGVCLRPGRAVVELKVRLYNRTPYTQTFLWWANVATRVHERYQSFFPTDVRYVADHAKRAVTTFPQSKERYYGVDYPARAREGVPAEEQPRMFVPDGSYAADDLSWYANIPVPTSYMLTGTEEDFFGGYDHAAGAGVVHVADHHVAPGKKQWTWGNHEFGYAWDRSLTDADGPYIELMAGVYTDNQPDFSYLAPWETKTFVQSWYPVSKIGVPKAANVDAALSVSVDAREVKIGLYVTGTSGMVGVVLRQGAREIGRWREEVSVARPLLLSAANAGGVEEGMFAVSVTKEGQTLLEYDPQRIEAAKAPKVAIEPPLPSDVATVEELYLIGLHLEQYRHATRDPELYWREALRRDPDDSRVNNALGLRCLQRGEFAAAERHFEVALGRVTAWNGNPRDGEPFYNLGLARRFQGRDKPAYDAFFKATWSAAWRASAYFALAEIDCARGDWGNALDHVDRSLVADADNLAARNLRVLVLDAIGRDEEARAEHDEIRALDPLDIYSRWRDGISPRDGQERLDLAFDLLRSGQKGKARKVLEEAKTAEGGGSLAMELYALAQIEEEWELDEAEVTRVMADAAPLAYCNPSRLEELCVLEGVIAKGGEHASAHYLLGNFLYDRRRYAEAIEHWETAAERRPEFATVWRNLGIGLFNVRGDAAAAKATFERAMQADPTDGRVLYERDQLWKRTGEKPERRVLELERYPALTEERDDLAVELATLYNQLDQPERALDLLLGRHFQPWEGGEGLVLGQYVRARLLLGRGELERGDAAAALVQFEAALAIPDNLSEARHLLANQSDVRYWLGVCHQALGNATEARVWWERASRQHGDFEGMAVRSVSKMTYWRAMAHVRLEDREQAERMFKEVLAYSFELEQREPKIDYFATSLPSMLLFQDDLKRRNTIEARFLRAQALSGLGETAEASGLLRDVLVMGGNHAEAADLLRRGPELAAG